MKLDVQEVLRQLCREPSPSGFEGGVGALAAKCLEGLVDEVRTDRMGNVIGVRRCGRENAPRLLLDAHLDEVGFIVTGIEDGFLRIAAIGGVDARILPDRELTILTKEPIFGVVACLPPHVLKKEESDQAQDIEALCVDIGMSQAQAEKAVPIGTPAVYREDCLALGEGQVCGKSLDDRSCFAAVLRALELLKDKSLDVDLYAVGSVCEEVGGWGAETAAYHAAPTYCVAVDVTFGATPDEPKSKGHVLLETGAGPAIGVGPSIPVWMSDRLEAKAKAEGIPYQVEILSGQTGTNGDDYQTAREGIATAVLSLPLKYMHTPLEVVELSDLEHTAQLLSAFAQGLGEEAKSPC